MDVVSHLVKGTQCGGIRHRGTDIAALTVRIWEACGKYEKRSTANKYMDIRSAYYSTIRQRLIRLPSDPDDLFEFLDTLPLPLALNDILRAAISLPGLLNEIPDTHLYSPDTHLYSTLQDLLQNAWFSRGESSISQQLRGAPDQGIRWRIYFLQSARRLSYVLSKIPWHIVTLFFLSTFRHSQLCLHKLTP